MKRDTKRTPSRDADERNMSTLLHAAGPRPEAPDALRARVHDRTRSEWKRSVARRRRTRRLGALAVAAAALVAALLVFRPGLDRGSGLRPESAQEGAALVATFGDVRVSGHESRTPEEPGALPSFLEPREWLTTGPAAGARLALEDGTSVRVDANTRLRVRPQERLMDLRSGRIYVDAEDAPGSLRVVTSLGFVEDVGTQFEVAITGSRLETRVRRGAVRVQTQSTEAILARGESLLVSGDGWTRRSTVSPTDSSWNWIHGLGLVPGGERHRVHDLLAWHAREQGLVLSYASPELTAEAEKVEVRGDLSLLPREQMIELALSTTRFAARPEGDRLIVSRRR